MKSRANPARRGEPMSRFRSHRFGRSVLGALLGAIVGLAALWGAPPAHAYHFPWDQGHDTTDWNDPNDPGPCEGDQCDPCKSTGSPVYLPTGHLIWSEVDVLIPGQPGVSLVRTYNSHDSRDGMFGQGWSTNCGSGLYLATASRNAPSGEVARYRIAWLRVGNGKRYAFEEGQGGRFVAPSGRSERIQLQADGSLRIDSRDRSVRIFDKRGLLLSEAASGGQARTYAYGELGQLLRITDSAGRYIAFAYNSRGRVETVTDSAGRAWRYGYDADGNLTSVQHPDGGTRRYAYRGYQAPGDGHTYFQLTKVTDEAGVVLADVGYSGERVASYTSGANRFSYTYNTTARTVTKTDLAGSQWVFTYDERGLLLSEQDPLRQTDRFTYDANGNRLSHVDPTGATWLWTYDDQGRMTSAANPLGEATTWRYEGDNPSPVEVLSPSGRAIRITYDSRFNPKAILDPTQASSAMSWGEGESLRELRDPLGNRITIVPDPAGLPLQITDALGRTTGFTYDQAGDTRRIVDAAGNATQIEYNARRQPMAVTEPSGRRTVYQRDLAGRVVKVVDPAGRQTLFTLDVHGRIVSQVLPDERRYSYSYRNDNLLSEERRPDGSLMTYGYDAAKRLVSARVGGETITYTYSARGELLSATSSSGTVSYTYDAAGRVLKEVTSAGTVSYAYNKDGERISRADVGGTTSYAYGPRGELQSITAPEGRYDFSYDTANRPSSLSYPNGTSARFTWDAADQLTRLAYSGRFNESFDYRYDARGLLASETSGAGRWDYTYDIEGRLVGAVSQGASYSFGFDPAGNLLGEGRKYDAGNRLVEDSGFTYSYDPNGNLVEKVSRTGGGRTVYGWNGWGQLVSVKRYPSASATEPSEVRAYTYDAMGRRQGRTVQGQSERFLYDGRDRIAVLDGASALRERVTFGPGLDAPLGVHGTSGARYLHPDRKGSIVAVSGDAGELGRYRYDPYGATLDAPAVGNDFRYTAREYEGEDLYYYRARNYDARMRRFVSEDPIGLAGGLNLYAYAESNPVFYNDPLGECPWCIGAGIGLGIELFSQLARNGWNWRCLDAGGLVMATAMGALGGGLGSRALTGSLRGLSNASKGRIGETLSIVKNRLSGSRLIETQTRSIKGYRTIVDSTWESRGGATYYVESKFGTSGLTAAQRRAANALGDQYRVERWGYDFFGNVGAAGGGIAGGGAGSAISAAGDKDCGCN
jgi:RHS repeat-associated protein